MEKVHTFEKYLDIINIGIKMITRLTVGRVKP